MRVLILSKRGMKLSFTGDSTQMKNTIDGIRSRCTLVTHIFIDDDGSLYDINDQLVKETLQSLCHRHDIAHQLPRLNYKIHAKIAPLMSIPVAISTIYWFDLSRVIIAWRNESGLRNRILSAARSWRAGRKNVQDYSRGCNMLLPNSWAEGQNVKKYFKLSKNVIIRPIPNGLNFPIFDLNELCKPATIPFDEYIVCPAAFATRKNQLGLIKAMKGSDIPIVFMGAPLTKDIGYWKECKRIATDNIYFMDHQSNNEKSYWAVLKHARCACLPSDCETPGIALLEASAAGARPIVTSHGGTSEYYGMTAEYFEPTNHISIRSAVENAWERGRLSSHESQSFMRFSWDYAVEETIIAYQRVIEAYSEAHHNRG